jgi:hypothetical protein
VEGELSIARDAYGAVEAQRRSKGTAEPDRLAIRRRRFSQLGDEDGWYQPMRELRTARRKIERTR